jgi:hypothetical protein
MKRIWKWLIDNTNSNAIAITAIAACVQAVSLVAAVIGLYIAWAQIDAAKDALKGTLTLQLQKDGRDLFGAMEPPVREYIYGYRPTETYKEEVSGNARQRIIQVLNYYASAHRQYTKDRIDAEAWLSMKPEMCRFLKYVPVGRIWEQAIELKIYPEKFREVGQQCLTETSK